LADVLLRGGPQKLIVDQLRLSCQHLDKLGLKETELYTRLSKTYEESKTSRENDWDKEKRLAVANEAFSLLRRLGDVIEATQPDFE
jgi:hypothetical protein